LSDLVSHEGRQKKQPRRTPKRWGGGSSLVSLAQRGGRKRETNPKKNMSQTIHRRGKKGQTNWDFKKGGEGNEKKSWRLSFHPSARRGEEKMAN